MFEFDERAFTYTQHDALLLHLILTWITRRVKEYDGDLAEFRRESEDIHSLKERITLLAEYVLTYDVKDLIVLPTLNTATMESDTNGIKQ